ncbi:F0F1 ATP synthase subunit delta [Pelagicoccus albus]|uniref:F0F1 ATP synthase subunit delta n=1 Tax=Pelagicoccus albus TaxID=415222 RepID=A0A7X1EAY0_9BACT|nr:F0F1 ATP synthase subunit delta [Pelagicoccus albus]MBC2607222.1 F0F1 ATP synthase subunit delta [Pelagicoccus albus]
MTRDKQIVDYAKGLMKLASENGTFSEERASAILQVLEKNPPRNYAGVLKEFLKLVKREVANNTAVVEYAGELSPSAIDGIKSQFTNRYGRDISVTASRNDALIAGLRVQVGCDVYDSSVAGALKELEATLS